ncbi:hypothetical protein BH23GEM9_BH23GEM9_04510 [soil metagenome]
MLPAMSPDPDHNSQPSRTSPREDVAPDQAAADRQRSRWAFLAAASRSLADSLDYEETLGTVAELALPLLGSWSIVDLTEPDGSISRLAIVHPDSGKQEVARLLREGWPPQRDDPVGAPAVARTGRTELIEEVTDELVERVARSDVNRRNLLELGITSILTVPMRARGRILGAITFVSSDRSRSFTADDISLAEDVGERCALAIDNALLHRAARDLVTTEKARLQAEAASQIKGEFLATVSHELRTPLNVMAGYLELLAMELAGPLTATQRDYITRLQGSEQQLLRIVEDMLNFVRLYSKDIEYRMTNIAPADVVREVSDAYRQGLVEKGLTLDVECEDTFNAYADPAKVWQILMNLLSNARKFTPAGGRVRVECATAGGTTVIRVSDTGCGIPEDKLESIFEPFVQAEGSLSRTAEGMGLGLSISRHLARDMGGELGVESEAGKGCSFTLTLQGRSVS